MVLAAVGLIVVATAVYVLSANSVANNRDELTKLERETQTAQAQATALSPYKQFQSLKQSRVTTIQQLASSRFDWQRVMRELAIVIPADVWLTSLVGTVTPDVSIAASGGGSSSGGLRSAIPVPAVELVGCTTGQAEVSRFMSRLRAIDGVTRVSLSSSEKQDNGGAAGAPSSGGSAGATGACSSRSKGGPQFDMVVFFGGAAQAAPGVGSAGGNGATPAPPSAAANTNTPVKGPK